MLGYGNTVNQKFMEAYLGASVTGDSAAAGLGASAVLQPTPTQWLKWGQVMPVSQDLKSNETNSNEASGVAGLDVIGDPVLGGAYNVMTWTNWMTQVPTEKKVSEKDSKVAVSLYQRN